MNKDLAYLTDLYHLAIFYPQNLVFYGHYDQTVNLVYSLMSMF